MPRRYSYLEECELVHAHGAEGADTSIPEQLQWYPGLAVTGIETAGASGDHVPVSASAVVRV